MKPLRKKSPKTRRDVDSGTMSKQRSQSEKFRRAARELGCDEDEAAFDAKLKSIAGQKPKPDKDKASDRSTGATNSG